MCLQANAIGGRNEKAVREFLEKNWAADQTEDASVRLAVKALMEVVDSGSKNIEVAIVRKGQVVHVSLMQMQVQMQMHHCMLL